MQCTGAGRERNSEDRLVNGGIRNDGTCVSTNIRSSCTRENEGILEAISKKRYCMEMVNRH